MIFTIFIEKIFMLGIKAVNIKSYNENGYLIPDLHCLVKNASTLKTKNLKPNLKFRIAKLLGDMEILLILSL